MTLSVNCRWENKINLKSIQCSTTIFHRNRNIGMNRGINFVLVSYLTLLCTIMLRVRVMVFNATFNNSSVISWRSVLLVEETGVHPAWSGFERTWVVLNPTQHLDHFRNNFSIFLFRLWNESPGNKEINIENNKPAVIYHNIWQKTQRKHE
jgi:hypothetical protein